MIVFSDTTLDSICDETGIRRRVLMVLFRATILEYQPKYLQTSIFWHSLIEFRVRIFVSFLRPKVNETFGDFVF